MQRTILSGSDAKGKAGDGGDLFGREFVPYHLRRDAISPLRKLFHFGHCLSFSRIPTPT